MLNIVKRIKMCYTTKKELIMKLNELKNKEDLPKSIKDWLIKNDLDKMTDGEWFYPGDEKVCDARIDDKIFELNHTKPSEVNKIDSIINDIIRNDGGLCVVLPFYAEFGYIEAGEGCFIGNNCTFIDGGGIFLGNNVMIAPKVVLATATHPIDAELRTTYLTKCSPIIIEDNVWIGANSTILGGVNIGANSIIGAGSVVTHDIPSNCVAVGNPCKVIKTLTVDKDLKELKDYLEK